MMIWKFDDKLSKKTVVLTCNSVRLKALYLVSRVWLCILEKFKIKDWFRKKLKKTVLKNQKNFLSLPSGNPVIEMTQLYVGL